MKTTNRTAVVAVVMSALYLGACGSDDVAGPGSGSRPGSIPNVAGIYSSSSFWVHQVLRTSDGFMTSFTCSGSITITQQPNPTNQAADRITGFAVVGSPCPAVSFDLTGSIAADGTVQFVSGGPKPPQGPCPAAANVAYSGGMFDRRLNVRGSGVVMCPEFGEHRFTYIVAGTRS